MPYFSITRKVALGYLAVIAFSLLRNVRQNLLGQENLEKQLVILRDSKLLVLLERRSAELDSLIIELKHSDLPDYIYGVAWRHG